MKSLIIIAAILAVACSVPFPKQALLHAPFTPFSDDTMSVKLSTIPKQSAESAKMGVNLIWVAGGMGQFETLNITERKSLFKAWTEEGHKNNQYIVAHVGTTVLSDAIELAKYAKEVGADAIGTVPPYYEKPQSAEDVAMWLYMIAQSVPGMPIFYYHIPGSTGVNIQIYDLIQQVEYYGVDQFLGVKYVSSDLFDFLNCQNDFGDKYKLMFAPEPKLVSFPIGASHTVLAEDFFAQSYLRMYEAYHKGDIETAQQEQLWKQKVSAVFGKFTGNAERSIYPYLINEDLGPPRFPQTQVDPCSVAQLIGDLNEYDFFTKAYPQNQTKISL